MGPWEVNVMTYTDTQGVVHLAEDTIPEGEGYKIRPLNEVNCLGCLQDTIAEFMGKEPKP